MITLKTKSEQINYRNNTLSKLNIDYITETGTIYDENNSPIQQYMVKLIDGNFSDDFQVPEKINILNDSFFDSIGLIDKTFGSYQKWGNNEKI